MRAVTQCGLAEFRDEDVDSSDDGTDSDGGGSSWEEGWSKRDEDSLLRRSGTAPYSRLRRFGLGLLGAGVGAAAVAAAPPGAAIIDCAPSAQRHASSRWAFKLKRVQ